MMNATTEERFWRKVRFIPCGGCWEWTASLDGGGYGRFWADEKTHKAHRWSYEDRFGPIPDGLVIDHLCRNTVCVNPAHLEAVTVWENTRRGRAPIVRGTINASKTHCKNGHEFAGENLYVNRTTGSRDCRTCSHERNRQWRMKRAGLLVGDGEQA